MKEIKFRVWDNDLEIMSYSDSEIFIMFSNNGICIGYEINDEIDDYELMQYIGLKDKNGEEIYEGDIVKFFEYKVIDNIVLPEEIVIIKDIREGCDALRPSQHMEVIGNIYENPELLEKYNYNI